MAMKRFNLEFTKDGKVFSEAQVANLLGDLAGVTDLIVVSHGWNNDMADAQELYDELLGNVDKLLDARNNPALPHLAALGARVFAACQVFWPSKRFTDEELIPGGGAVSADKLEVSDAALAEALDELAEDPIRLGQKRAPAVRKALVKRAKKLIGDLDTDERARADFVSVLRQLLDPDHASLDDASVEFFTEDTEKLFDSFEDAVVAPGAVTAGGSASADAGGAAGIRDVFKGARAAARRIANFATYYRMKARAGTVGSVGLAPMLRRVREQQPTIRLHLVGHSFGGRLVTAAAHELPDNTPNVSLTLLQAAFSHNGLSANFDGGEPGGYRNVVEKKRASGPILITHTKNDRAVGIAYPLASRVAFQKAAALGDANDPYGGMGRNGAQRTDEVSGAESSLETAGHPYGFAQGSVYNLLADAKIRDHSDVRGPEVAYAILCAGRAL